MGSETLKRGCVKIIAGAQELSNKVGILSKAQFISWRVWFTGQYTELTDRGNYRQGIKQTIKQTDSDDIRI